MVSWMNNKYRCRFCKQYCTLERLTENLKRRCPNCGYKLISIFDDSVLDKITAIYVKFSGKATLLYKPIIIDCVDLYNIWKELSTLFKRNELYSQAVKDTFYISSFNQNQEKNCFNLNANDMSNLTMNQTKIIYRSELWYDHVDPKSGFRVYENKMTDRGCLDVSELTPSERGIFLSWFLNYEPCANNSGELKFVIN